MEYQILQRPFLYVTDTSEKHWFVLDLFRKTVTGLLLNVGTFYLSAGLLGVTKHNFLRNRSELHLINIWPDRSLITAVQKAP